MGRPSNERLEELMNASWRDLTEPERRSAMREMCRRAKDPGIRRIFVGDLLRAHPGLSALEAWDKAKGLHEMESRTPPLKIYNEDAVEAASQPVDAGSDDDSDVWLDEPPADEHRNQNASVMDMITEYRRHPGKWHRFGCSTTRKQAQTRAASIRRNKKTWAGFDARAIDHNQRHETWISYQGDAK